MATLSNADDRVEDSAMPQEAISEKHAEPGIVLYFGVPITLAERWTEAGLHVIRSTEFGLVASGETLASACTAMFETLEDYAESVASGPSEQITEGESRDAAAIFSRLARGYRAATGAVEQEMTRRRTLGILMGRRRRLNRGIGFQSTRARSRQPSNA